MLRVLALAFLAVACASSDPAPIKSTDVSDPAAPYAYPWSSWDGALPAIDEAALEAKYTGFDLEALQEARLELRSELNAARAAAFATRQDAGLATVVPAAYSAGADEEEPEILMPDDSVTTSEASGAPYIVTGAGYGEDGVFVSYDWLPPTEYPELYRMGLEADWLRERILLLRQDSQR